MDHPPSPPEPPAPRAPDDAAAVAAEQQATWAALDGALRDVIGARGVTAIYGRSLHLAARQHAWLAAVACDRERPLDPAPLLAALAAQPAADARAAGMAVLLHFRTLLAGLIGESLTARLLVAVPSPVPGGPGVQEDAP